LAGIRIPDAKSAGLERPKSITRITRNENSQVKPGLPVKPDVAVKAGSIQKTVPGGVPADVTKGQTLAALKLFEEAAVNLGIQKDQLSAALLVFTRFFSLPPDKKLLENLRREVYSSFKASHHTAKEKSDILAIAAVIAADKGVILTPEALERYANFFEFPPGSPENTPEGSSKDDKEKRRDHDKTQDSKSPLEDGEELRAIAESEAAKDEFLDIMNTLPGKNGHYWLVFPFNITVRGIELKVLVRILNNRRSSASSRFSPEPGCRLIADISGSRRQWRFFLKENGGKFSADIRVYPECRPRALAFLQKEAERFLGKGGGIFGNFGGFQDILVRNGDEKFSWADELSTDCLPFIDGKV